MNWLLTIFLIAFVAQTCSTLSMLTEDQDPMKEQLEMARLFCMSQKETDFCDGFLCRQLFDLPSTYSSEGLMSSKRSGASKGMPPPPYGTRITHLRFGRKRRSASRYLSGNEEDNGNLSEQCQNLGVLIKNFMEKNQPTN